MSAKIEKAESLLGYQFKNKDWAERALTHASAGAQINYERLEFLGDRVLGLVIANALFEQFPDEKEGALAKRLSALVRGETLADIGRDISIQNLIMMSDWEESHGGTDNDNVIADVMEALLGAMYQDGGLHPCEAFIRKNWASRMDTMIAPPQDPKTALQEWAQGRGLPVPVYTIENQDGPDHAPLFTISVTVEGQGSEAAKGPSRRHAEKQAARKLLKSLDALK